MHSTTHWKNIRCTIVVLIMTAMVTVASYDTANVSFAKAKATQPLILALQHIPRGTADLRWNATDHTLVVTMTGKWLGTKQYPSSYTSTGLQQFYG